jgi:hypothetical protein
MTRLVPDAATLAGRILALARAEARAIECDDWVQFDRLADERDELQAQLSQSPTNSRSELAAATLRQAQAVDDATAQLIRGLQSLTGVRVRQVHHAYSALQGYERPIREEPAPILLDAER